MNTDYLFSWDEFRKAHFSPRHKTRGLDGDRGVQGVAYRRLPRGLLLPPPPRGPHTPRTPGTSRTSASTSPPHYLVCAGTDGARMADAPPVAGPRGRARKRLVHHSRHACSHGDVASALLCGRDRPCLRSAVPGCHDAPSAVGVGVPELQ